MEKNPPKLDVLGSSWLFSEKLVFFYYISFSILKFAIIQHIGKQINVIPQPAFLPKVVLTAQTESQPSSSKFLPDFSDYSPLFNPPSSAAPWPPFSPFVCRNIPGPNTSVQQVCWLRHAGLFISLLSAIFTLLPPSSDPPCSFSNAASMLLLVRWGDPRGLMLIGDRWVREPPPSVLSYPSARGEPRDSTPPSVIRYVTAGGKLNLRVCFSRIGASDHVCGGNWLINVTVILHALTTLLGVSGRSMKTRACRIILFRAMLTCTMEMSNINKLLVLQKVT